MALVTRYSGRKELPDGRIFQIDFTQVYDPGDGWNDPPETDTYDEEYYINGIRVDYLDLPKGVTEELIKDVMSKAESVPYNFGPPGDLD